MALIEPTPEEFAAAEESIRRQFEERRHAGWRYRSPEEALEAWVGLYRATRGFTMVAVELRCGGCGRLLLEVEADDGYGVGPMGSRFMVGHQHDSARGRGWPVVLVPYTADGATMDAGFQAVPPARRATASVAPWGGSPLEYDRDRVRCHPKRCGRSYVVRSESLIAAISKVMINGRRYLVVGGGDFAREKGGQDL